MNRTLHIVRLGVPLLRSGAGTHDPALDTSVPGAAQALSRHERERSEESVKALPVKANARPVVFHAQRLGSRAMQFVSSSDGDRRVMNALACGCHEYIDARGVTVQAKDHGGVETVNKIAIASEEWTEHLYDTFGMQACREVAAVIVQASEAPPDATDPFALPHGLTLPR